MAAPAEKDPEQPSPVISEVFGVKGEHAVEVSWLERLGPGRESGVLGIPSEAERLVLVDKPEAAVQGEARGVAVEADGACSGVSKMAQSAFHQRPPDAPAPEGGRDDQVADPGARRIAGRRDHADPPAFMPGDESAFRVVLEVGFEKGPACGPALPSRLLESERDVSGRERPNLDH